MSEATNMAIPITGNMNGEKVYGAYVIGKRDGKFNTFCKLTNSSGQEVLSRSDNDMALESFKDVMEDYGTVLEAIG